MKIAYTFCGHARTWEQCRDGFFENIYSVAPGDIYMHLWDTVNSDIGSWWNGWGDLTGERLELSRKPIDINRIKEMYNPKKILVEKDKSIDSTIQGHPSLRPQLAVRNVLESHKKSYELIERPSEYDKIFCTRLDIKYESKLDLQELETESLIYADHPLLDTSRYISDIWLIGSPEQIKIKTDIVDQIDDLWYSKPNFIHIIPEAVVTEYLRSNNMQFVRSKIQYSVPRLF